MKPNYTKCTERLCSKVNHKPGKCIKRPKCHKCGQPAHNQGTKYQTWRWSYAYSKSGGFICAHCHTHNPNNDLKSSELDEVIREVGYYDGRPKCQHAECDAFCGFTTTDTGIEILNLLPHPYVDGKRVGFLEINGKHYCQEHYLQHTPCFEKFESIDTKFKSSMATLSGYGLHKLFHPDCENDGTIGIGPACTSTIIDKGQLQVDHKDGNHSNDSPDNLQTLCGNCHYLKTLTNKDYLTSSKGVPLNKVLV